MSLEEGLKYPWVNGRKQWYALWILLPIIGWFALGGYVVRIVQAIVSGNKNGLPEWVGFWDNFKKGFRLFVLLLPIIAIIMVFSFIPYVGSLLNFLASFLYLPYIVVHVIMKNNFKASWDVETWWRVVIQENFKEYVLAWLRSLVYGIAYFLLSFILIGIPGSLFGKQIFFADFYRRCP